MKEKIKAIEEYLKYFPNDFNAKNNLLLCKYADELNIELSNDYYPRIAYGCFVINSQIEARKEYALTNSATQYKQNGKDTIIVWHASYGRLTFVKNEYYDYVDDEWNDFINVLKSYNPVDYDELNRTYIYNVENGKKLIHDYKDIIQNFKQKLNKKIKEVDIANKKKEIERLQKELKDVDNECDDDNTIWK